MSDEGFQLRERLEPHRSRRDAAVRSTCTAMLWQGVPLQYRPSEADFNISGDDDLKFD
jgi:hypothetical protein